jgi:DNA-binding CsgD family transcriptional regulator
VFANLAACDLATPQHGVIFAADGRLRAMHPGKDKRLQRLIRGATETGRGLSSAAGGPLTIPRDKAQPLHLMITPLSVSSVTLAPGIAAAVFITDPLRFEASPQALLASVYGFTPAEARLAAALVNGQSLRQHAEAQQLSQETVRSQLKNVFRKADVRRQADLVRVLMSCPQMLFAQANGRMSDAVN